MNAFEAIAFDKDGTIFDSERIYARAFHLACAHFGFQIEEALREQMTGLAAEASIAYLQEHWGGDFHPESFIAYWRGEHRRIINEDGLPLMPHIEEVILQAYEAGYPLALVTSDDHDGMLQDFSGYPELFSAFSVIVTIDNVAKAKPDGDPYRRAAALLGVDPEKLLVIEDSQIGARAALDAGCQLIYYPSSSKMDPKLAEQACRVINDPAEILAWL